MPSRKEQFTGLEQERAMRLPRIVCEEMAGSSTRELHPDDALTLVVLDALRDQRTKSIRSHPQSHESPHVRGRLIGIKTNRYLV